MPWPPASKMPGEWKVNPSWLHWRSSGSSSNYGVSLPRFQGSVTPLISTHGGLEDMSNASL